MAAKMPAPQVVMPLASSESGQASDILVEKAKTKKKVSGKQKHVTLKTGSGSNLRVTSAEKKKEADTVAYLKLNQECDPWFDLNGSTGDAAAYQQIKASGYTKLNAPVAVQKQIAIGVAKCNQKYLTTGPAKSTASETIKPPAEEGKFQVIDSKDHSVSLFSKVGNSVTQFFSNIKNGGTSKHACRPEELVMHSNEC